MTAAPGTYASINRDDYPTIVTVCVPFGGTCFACAGWKYADGRVSRVMVTNPRWLALSESQRDAMTVHPSWLDHSKHKGEIGGSITS